MTCRDCGKRPAAEAIGTCPDCLRGTSDPDRARSAHPAIRRGSGLPADPPHSPGGTPCTLCSNSCRLGPGEKGYCGLRENLGGSLRTIVPAKAGLAHAYFDPLPTNCCAAWFCGGSTAKGANLAVFLYGCNLNCLFCQNASHKNLAGAPVLTEDALVRRALEPQVRCVCFFGGSPEPQFPFALGAARRIIEESGNTKRICWEWNGCGRPDLAVRAAELSSQSGGTVKFDLKAFSPGIAQALCGVDISRAFENISRLAGTISRPDILTATTLLVPDYVDRREVAAIARFLADTAGDIPYSLLVFHPDYAMTDLPVTPRTQVEECARAARSVLPRVHIGNRHLIDRLF